MASTWDVEGEKIISVWKKIGLHIAVMIPQKSMGQSRHGPSNFQDLDDKFDCYYTSHPPRPPMAPYLTLFCLPPVITSTFP